MRHLTKSLLSVFLIGVSCTQKEELVDIQETAQQIGDVMASVDESGGSTGSLALMDAQKRYFTKKTDQLPGINWDRLWNRIDVVTPLAHAANCKDVATFGTCSNNVITRDFNDCTLGEATFRGTVTLTYDDLAVDNVCSMITAGHSVTRVPDFEVSGRRSATLTVRKSATQGQVITRGAGAGDFSLSNDGVRRIFAVDDLVLFDYTTRTTANIIISGATRSDRVMNGGNLRITNNDSRVSCDYTPSNVAWSATCNCATSGTWNGTCTDDTVSSLEITGCGTATFTMGEAIEDLSFDRCESL